MSYLVVRDILSKQPTRRRELQTSSVVQLRNFIWAFDSRHVPRVTFSHG
jgi:hypothetical protein